MNLYCTDKFQSYQEDNSITDCNQIIRQSFSVTKGESILSNLTLDKSICVNTAEEADQKLVHYMIQCVRSSVKQCVVRTVDTNVISLIAHRQPTENFYSVVFACLISAVSNKFSNINKITEKLSKKKCRALPLFYALTGCNIL